MTLKHPSQPVPTSELAVDPLFRLRAGPDSAARAPGRRDAPGRRVPDHPRRADARRQRAAQRGHVRLDVDGASGREADGRVLRQEHDRQGRVPADGRARVALRRDPEQPLERARRESGDRLFDDRVERGGDARRARAQAQVAETAPGRGQAGGQAEPRDGDQRPGLLGEARELLGRRDAARADGGRPLQPLARGGREALRREHDRRRRHPRLDLRRLVRADRGAVRAARQVPGGDRPRHPGARRRRVRGDDRAVHRSRPRVGLPAAARGLDQHVRPQVRARLPRGRLDHLARHGRACPRT